MLNLIKFARQSILMMSFFSGIFVFASTSNNEIFAQDGLSSLKEDDCCVPILLAPIAVSDDNIYITWTDNRTGNWEVFFAKSTDDGKTFQDSINLSNSPNSKSENVEIITNNDKIYITFWDNKDGKFVPYFVSSSDAGQTFSKPILLNITDTVK